MKQTLPDRNNTAIVVVTYNPGEDFATNMKRYARIAALVIIVDNDSDNKSHVREIAAANNAVFIGQNQNTGIAAALNMGIKKGLTENKEWILTLDDDSLPNEEILPIYANFISRYDHVGIIGTTFSRKRFKTNHATTCTDSLTVITSGSLHHRNIFHKIGYYEEKLFIDCVDFDFTIRVKIDGEFSVKRIAPPLIIHHIGDPVKKRGLSSWNHSALRRYYWARNTVYLNKKYLFYVPAWITKKDFFFLKDLLLIAIVEDDRLQKFKAIAKGIRDGLTL